MSKYEPIYPIFIECMSYTEDDFWKSFFENASKGKFHKDTYITKDDTLVFQTTKERLHLSIHLPAEELAKKMISLHQEHFNYYSPHDLEVRSNLVQDMKDNYQRHEYETWKKVKRQCDQGSLITEYLKNWEPAQSLSPSEIQNAVRDLLFYIEMKLLDDTMIKLKDGVIVNIDNITVEDGKISIIKLPKTAIKKTTKKVVQKKTKSLTSEWKKYLKSAGVPKKLKI